MRRDPRGVVLLFPLRFKLSIKPITKGMFSSSDRSKQATDDDVMGFVSLPMYY